MEVICHIKDCVNNKEGHCSKDKIEIMSISSYDIDNAECLDYETEEK